MGKSNSAFSAHCCRNLFSCRQVVRLDDNVSCCTGIKFGRPGGDARCGDSRFGGSVWRRFGAAQSSWQLTLPVGGFASQSEFLNGAALVETSHSATGVLALLQQIESRHGRARGERWGSRTLDLDLLLFGDAIIDTPALTVPHPRMSFRRFVLEPAAEIAGEMVHPAIGWTIERLVEHLDAGSDCVAIISPDDSAARGGRGDARRTVWLDRRRFSGTKRGDVAAGVDDLVDGCQRPPVERASEADDLAGRPGDKRSRARSDATNWLREPQRRGARALLRQSKRFGLV